MRAVIRQQLQAGQSEQEVIQYFVSRYGDRILLSPPMQGLNLLAWLVPIALMLGGVILVFLVLRNWHSYAGMESNEDESTEAVHLDEQKLATYQQQIERELAAEDPVFSPSAKEVE
jgi:cytochrome c-type biogenesis protein CcmH